MTPTSVVSSTPPTARSPTRCTCSTGSLGYTIELDGGSGSAVGGTTTAGNAVGTNPSGFVFQDREADVEAVFAKNLPFMLDLAQSAPHAGPARLAPRRERPRTSSRRRSRRPTATRRPSRSTCGARSAPSRSTGRSRARPGRADGPTAEFNGGERYGESGVYYHRMRGSVTGFNAGDKVKVWFTAAGGKSLRAVHVHRVGAGPRQPRARPVRRGLHGPLAEHGADRRPVVPGAPTWTRWPTPASPPTSTTSTLRAATRPTCSACSATTRP